MASESVTVFEYCRMDLTSLDSRDKKTLDQLSELGIIEKTHLGYKTNQYVGILPLKSTTIEILPKIFKKETEGIQQKNRYALLKLLSYTEDFHLKK